MAWDAAEERDSPSHLLGDDKTLMFDRMQIESGSFLLDEHSYDNYLDGLGDDDVSFAVPPFASSTPAARKSTEASGGVEMSRLAQLRSGEALRMLGS